MEIFCLCYATRMMRNAAMQMVYRHIIAQICRQCNGEEQEFIHLKQLMSDAKYGIL